MENKEIIVEILKANRYLSTYEDRVKFYEYLEYLRMLPREECDYHFFCQLCNILEDDCNEPEGMTSLTSQIEQIYLYQPSFNPQLLWDYLKASFKIFEKSKSYFAANFFQGTLTQDEFLELIFLELESDSEYSHFLKEIFIDWYDRDLLEEIFGEDSKRIYDFIKP